MGQLVSFVIPCYRSENTIQDVILELDTVMKTRTDVFEYEIILVNDGSPDGTLRVLFQMAQNRDDVVVVDFSKNFGQHAALMSGFGQVRGDIVVSLDDDGQIPVDEVFKLLDKVCEGYDFVTATYPAKKHNVVRRWGSWINQKCNEVLLGIPKNLRCTSFFACKRFVVESALTYQNPYPYVGGLLLRAAGSFAGVPVKHRQRANGHSGYNLVKLIALWANGFTAFSIKPLRFASFFGIFVSLAGFAFGLHIVISKIINPSIAAGWSSTIALIAVLGGIMLLVLGLIGEYIGRIYMCINNQPQYIIRCVADKRAPTPGAGKLLVGAPNTPSQTP